MRANYKPNFKNRPPHIHTEPGYYFITIRTVQGQWFLRPDAYKQILLNVLHEKTKKFNLFLIAYVILNNHYHIIINFPETQNFSKFINELNGASARSINVADHVVDRKIWWNYFETQITGEQDFHIHLNYIHQNPIKHGVGKSLNYKFSSYSTWVKIKGQEYLDDSFRKYPIVDFKIFNDDH